MAAPHRRRRARARPGPTCVTAGTRDAIDAIARPLPPHDPAPGRRVVGDRRTVVRRPLRGRRHLRRGLPPHRRRAGRRGRRARRGAVRRARLAAGRRADGRAPRAAAADRRGVEVEVLPGAVVPRPGVGAARRRPARATASGWSTVTASRPTRPASGARCSSPTCDNQRVLSDIKLAVDVARRRAGHGAPAARAARRGDHRGRLGRPRPRRRARPPHVALDPRAGRARSPARWRASPSWCDAARQCPWDREQTHQSLTRHLLEETYEVLEAIDALPAARPAPTRPTPTSRRSWATCCSRSCSTPCWPPRTAQFTLADVARGIHDKLVRRHPHVFGARRGRTMADDITADWEDIKGTEKGRRPA